MRGVWFRSRIAVIVMIIVLSLSSGVVQAAPPWQEATSAPSVFATVAVERAVVLPFPDRTFEPLLYLYERERVPVMGQSADGVFLYVPVDNLYGWVVRAQFDIEGDLATVPVVADNAPQLTPTLTITPFGMSDGAQPTAPTVMTPEPGVFPTRTPLPTRTPIPSAADSALTPVPTGNAGELSGQILPGAPPPIALTLPDAWQAAHLIVPVQTFDGVVHDVPLSVYAGEIVPNVTGIIYVYWGFPNTVDWITGEYNLWSDGVQILRGSLVGESCNLGVYDPLTLTVGGLEGVGTNYQAADCTEEMDTAGWFVVVQEQGGTFAFYTAFEPWNAREDYRDDLQAILDSVVFLPPED